jgi:hypothetical protein
MEALMRFHLRDESASPQSDRGRSSFQIEAVELQLEGIAL